LSEYSFVKQSAFFASHGEQLLLFFFNNIENRKLLLFSKLFRTFYFRFVFRQRALLKKKRNYYNCADLFFLFFLDKIFRSFFNFKTWNKKLI